MSSLLAYANNVNRRRKRSGLRLSGTPVLTGTNGVAYAGFTVTAAGGKEAYAFSASGFPTGVSIHATTGVVSGTPTQSGTFRVQIAVYDANLRSARLPFFNLVVA